jgi:glutathionylspermidine synthase
MARAAHRVATGARLPASEFVALRARVQLEGCKWDAQVGDEATLADFPLVLDALTWADLSAFAGALARETLAAEAELVARPELHERLAVPRPVRRWLARRPAWAVAPDPARRVMRFDFHPTADGWRVSEVNSDVPGGFAESALLGEGLAAANRDLATCGDAGAAYVDAIAAASAGVPVVALVTAPRVLEDAQVVTYLARRLRAAGLAAHVVHPHDLHFADDGRVGLATPWCTSDLGALVRFHQAEWLAHASEAVWAGCFGARTPVFNAASALLTESKRLPLVWDALRSTDCAAWRALLPETRDPRDVDWARSPGWMLKAAYGNTGDEVVAAHGADDRRKHRAIARAARWRPGAWIAQRRFDTLPVETPDGLRFPCVGVYTLGERTIGAYGRLGRTPVIDYQATDVAVLVRR